MIEDLLVSLAAVLIAALLVACEGTPATTPGPLPVEVTVDRPVRKAVVEWDEYTGRLDAAETVEVRARVNGYLEKVAFKDGGKVRKGDLLFVIDPRPYRAAYDQAEAETRRAEAALELAQKEFARARRLFQTHTIAEETLDTRSANLVEAQAALRSASAAQEMARLNLEFTRVRAPINGRISRALVTEGNLVNGGSGDATPLTFIVSIDPIYVYFDVDERSVLNYRKLAREGKRQSARYTEIPVELSLLTESGFPHRGSVDFVQPRVDPATGTVRARGVFPNADDQLSPGFFARVRVPGSGEYQALLIHDRAIAAEQNQKYVLVVGEHDTVEQRAVKPGALLDGLRIIREGLRPDDRVIVEGIQRVRPGDKVKPQQAAEPGRAAATDRGAAEPSGDESQASPARK